MRLKNIFFWFLSAMLLISNLGEAKVIEMVITSKESPTFEALNFGSVGPYERLVGYVRGELKPTDPLNAGIVNIDKTSRNIRGYVEYKVDVFILKPMDLKKGNGRILYDVLNRGDKLCTFFINSGPRGNNPRLAADVGTGFLMKEGYTIVWSGWQCNYSFPGESAGLPSAGGDRMFAHFPIATKDGNSLVGLSREEFIEKSNKSPFIGNLSYPAADIYPALATLTVRENQTDPRKIPKDLTWRYLNQWQIEITRPTGFDGGAIYEFIYPAKDPIVMGMAFASVRDVVSYLRYGICDDLGNPNPLAPDGRPSVQKTLGMGISQSGRFLRDFIYQDFNIDENGRQVFDGALPIVAGSRKNFCNFEFAQPGRWSRQHADHLQPGDQFPFTYGVLTDPVSGRTDGILAKCQKTGTCPKIMHVDTDSELWQARASLVVTDTTGVDITLPDNVRAYLFASAQHNAAWVMSRRICQNLSNPLDYRPFLRALIVALDEWVSGGVAPPASRFPKRADGTLVPPDRASTKFPYIPGVIYNGLLNGLRLTDYSVQPPIEGEAYPVFVSRVDSDGNGVAGILHPFIEVPTATHTGWNLRALGQAENELCSSNGSYIPFAKTRDDRLALGDPRLSIEERYPNHDNYVSKVAKAVERLVRERLLIEEDARIIIEAVTLSNIGKPKK